MPGVQPEWGDVREVRLLIPYHANGNLAYPREKGVLLRYTISVALYMGFYHRMLGVPVTWEIAEARLGWAEVRPRLVRG